MTQVSPQTVVGESPGALALAPADIWRMVRKRIWLIVACLIVLGFGGAGGIVAWYFIAPMYTAEGVIEVEPGGAQRMALTAGYGQAEVPIGLFDQYIESQAMAVKNTRVLRAALESLGSEQTMYTTGFPIYDLSQDLSVGHIPNTQYINVSLTGTDKKQIQAIVREVLTAYISQIQSDQRDTDAQRQQELRTERDDLRRQMEELSRKLARYRDEYSVVVADERNSEQMARLTALVRQLTITEAFLAETRAAWEQFQELRKQAEESNDLAPILMGFPEVTEALRSDRTIVGLRQQTATLEQLLESMNQRFGERHEQVRRLQVQVQAARNDLEAQRAEILNQLVQQQGAVLKNRYDQARAAEADIQARVAEARAAAVSVAKLAAEYLTLEDEYRRVQALLNTVEDGLERMRISAALSRPNVRVRSMPDVPVEVTQPRVWLYSIGTIVFSLLVGVGLSLLIELVDTRLRTPAQVVRQVGVPLLASVPDLTEDERLSLDTNLAMVSHTVPESLIAESFRQLRTSLLFASDQPIKSLLVSSANPSDGKTTVASNLAITLARAGGRVLLVEANFRRPALARVFDVPDRVGLSNVLVGLNSASEAIQATAVENLDLLVAGASPPSPAELLGSESMRRLVTDQVQAYDQVIIDGAPMLLVTDNHLLADIVDGIVLVFQADQNTRGIAQRAVREVVALRAHLFGAVLNRIRATKGGYFRQSFEAYYDYAGGSQGTLSRSATVRASARPQSSTPPLDEAADEDMSAGPEPDET
ncbi:MAG: polysaccharide biosynthesis tyrosine autokinase [Planctomycetes bacterium]|nr:polysaccharide biosynthesis tyrosine autokinase [Planctomycetota bacterium]